MSNTTITQRKLDAQEYVRRADAGFLNSLASFVARQSFDTDQTDQISHVHRSLDGQVRDAEDLYTVIEDIRDQIRALRDGFEEERRGLNK